jgi:hypothetical protein
MGLPPVAGTGATLESHGWELKVNNELQAVKTRRPSSGAVLVRTSERQSFLTCRQQWYWSWVERLRAPGTSTALFFGDLVHQALAAYYIPGRRRGPKPAVTFEQLYALSVQVEKIWDPDLETKVDLLEMGVNMLERYVEHWQEADKEYHVVASEQHFSVPIGTLMGKRVWYVGTVDGVWRHLPSGKIRFAEHKTAAAISRDALALNEQVGAYWTFAPRWLRLKGILGQGEQIDGIVYNWLRKAIKRDDGQWDRQGRRVNKDGSISKRQPAKFFDRELTFRGPVEAERVKQRVKNEVLDMMAAADDPERFVYKNPGPQFKPNCAFCQFRDMCELHETGNDWEAFKHHTFGSWEPYNAHERIERF